ncbi:MAG: nitrilase [Firmicutes bacterium]|nr:nitrilase [Alicyclobacillaceae bacterium]MCL6496299.1 nitrilase [Bacillota bacterium]
MGYDLYTAVAIQPEIRVAETRADIAQNLQRCLELIDAAPQVQATAKEGFDQGFAPIKLISFPEFFIQGHEGHWPLEHYLEHVLIEIPGEETFRLSQKAREHQIFIAGCALERDPEWIAEGYFFNTHFIIDPRGEVIHKYRKVTEAIHYGLSISPHDVYDRFVARYGDALSSFLPVTETEIGKIGTITCMDGHFPETARALGIQGAEVILHPLLADPLMSPPMDLWQAMNKMRAWENVAYVVGASWGALLGGRRPKHIAPGKSMIVDYNGVVRAYADFPGEAIVSAVINLEELRRRRMDPSRNFPTLLRTEIYRKIYARSIYPPNQFAQAPPRTRAVRDPLAVIERFVAEGIYTPPTGYRKRGEEA